MNTQQEQQAKQAAVDLKNLVKHLIGYGSVIHLEPEEIFNSVRDRLMASLDMEEITAANLVRLCFQEISLEVLDKPVYTPAQMTVICKRGKAGK